MEEKKLQQPKIEQSKIEQPKIEQSKTPKPKKDSVREKIMNQGFAANHTADGEKLTKAGFALRPGSGIGNGYHRKNPSHIPQKENSIYFNDAPEENEGPYIANIGGQDFHYKDLDTAIDRASYGSGKSPWEGSRTFDKTTKSWRWPREDEMWDANSNGYIDNPNLLRLPSGRFMNVNEDGTYGLSEDTDNFQTRPFIFYHSPDEIKKVGYFKGKGTLLNGSNIMAGDGTVLSDEDYNFLLDAYLKGRIK